MPAQPKSPACKRAKHDACNGWASVDKDYGNTPCWCPCHDSDGAATEH